MMRTSANYNNRSNGNNPGLMSLQMLQGQQGQQQQQLPQPQTANPGGQQYLAGGYKQMLPDQRGDDQGDDHIIQAQAHAQAQAQAHAQAQAQAQAHAQAQAQVQGQPQTQQPQGVPQSLMFQRMQQPQNQNLNQMAAAGLQAFSGMPGSTANTGTNEIGVGGLGNGLMTSTGGNSGTGSGMPMSAFNSTGDLSGFNGSLPNSLSLGGMMNMGGGLGGITGTTASTMGAIPNSTNAAAAAAALKSSTIVNVWKWNLEDQMASLRDMIERYKYISVDCKFPGIVARPIGTFKSTSEYHYQTLRSNVDILQVIQIGLTFADEYGNHPVGTSSTWQFNFKFSLNEDICSSDGVELLRQSGIDFTKHETDGIDPFAFGELILTSGLVLDDSVNWITFHSGYDLGYILSIMLNKEVPVEERGFLSTLRTYFPTVWDVKCISKTFKLSNKSQLSEVADDFQVRRLPHPPSSVINGGTSIGGLNQAGNDAFITSGCFFEIKRLIGDANINKVRNYLFGLGEGFEDDSSSQQLNNNGSLNNNAAASAAILNAISGGSAPSSSSNIGVTNAANIFQFGKMGGGAL